MENSNSMLSLIVILFTYAAVMAHYIHDGSSQFSENKDGEISSFSYSQLIISFSTLGTFFSSILGLVWGFEFLLMVEVPEFLRVVGSMLCVAGLYLFVLAKRTLAFEYSPLKKALLPNKLITHGIYSKIRNPIYTANLIMLSSSILMTGSLLIIVFVSVLAIFYHDVVRREEEALVSKFNDDYQSYMDGTGRFLPLLAARGRKLSRSS